MEVTTVWLHLLIVDDDEMACLGLENRLRAMPFSHQMEIVSVHSGEEALEHAQRHTVDILLTDIQMAGMNGLDLIAGILKLNPQLCSVIITAYPSFPYAHQAIRLGVVDFLLKPVSRDEMRETIQKAVALVEERRKSAANRPADTANCADPVTWAKDYVHRHLSEEINMALVANQMNLSYTYPVIRPVVDLSGVTSGARAINGILPGSRSISVTASTRRAQETAAGISSRSGQNGVVSGILNPNETMQNGGVNVSGNFYFNNNQDVRALASEIAVLTRNQQRGVGG